MPHVPCLRSLLGRMLVHAFVLFTPLLSRAQSAEDAGLVLLAETYRQCMFGNEPSKVALDRLKKELPAEMSGAREFIMQTVTTKNGLTQKKYLTLPSDDDLRRISTVRQVYLDMMAKPPKGNAFILDSLRRTPATRPLMVHDYYSMLFSAVGNKNQPFNLAKLDLRLHEYGLRDDTEKAILFLECMHLCRSQIWGFMNIVRPPNTKRAMQEIGHFPKVNGAPYYEFQGLQFTDLEVVYDDSLQSYKGVEVNNYLNLLLMHILALSNENGSEDAVRKVLLGSALRDERLYVYAKDRAILERILEKR